MIHDLAEASMSSVPTSCADLPTSAYPTAEHVGSHVFNYEERVAFRRKTDCQFRIETEQEDLSTSYHSQVEIASTRVNSDQAAARFKILLIPVHVWRRFAGCHGRLPFFCSSFSVFARGTWTTFCLEHDSFVHAPTGYIKGHGPHGVRCKEKS